MRPLNPAIDTTNLPAAAGAGCDVDPKIHIETTHPSAPSSEAAHASGEENSTEAEEPKILGPRALKLLQEEASLLELNPSYCIREETQGTHRYLVIEKLLEDQELFQEIISIFGFYDFNFRTPAEEKEPPLPFQLLYNLTEAKGFIPEESMLGTFATEFSKGLSVYLTPDSQKLYFLLTPGAETAYFSVLKKRVEKSYQAVFQLLDSTLKYYLTHSAETAEAKEIHGLLHSVFARLKTEADTYLHLFQTAIQNAKVEHIKRLEAGALARRLTVLAEQKAKEAKEATVRAAMLARVKAPAEPPTLTASTVAPATTGAGETKMSASAFTIAGAGAGAGAGARSSSSIRAKSNSTARPSLFILAKPDPRPTAEKEASSLALRKAKLAAYQITEAEKARAAAALSPDEQHRQRTQLIAKEIIDHDWYLQLIEPRIPKNFDFINLLTCIGLYAPDDPDFDPRAPKLGSLRPLQHLDDLIRELNTVYKSSFPPISNEDFLEKVHKVFPFYDDEVVYEDESRVILGRSDPSSKEYDCFPLPASSKSLKEFYRLTKVRLHDLYEEQVHKATGEEQIESLKCVYNSLISSMTAYEESALAYHAVIKELAVRPPAPESESSLIEKMKSGEHPGAAVALAMLAARS